MGVFAKLSSFGLKQFSASNASNKSSGGYCTGTQQPSVESTELATYLVPGSAAVQVSGSAMATTVANLHPGQKILGIDVGSGHALIWATLQRVEVMPDTSMVQRSVMVGLGGDDTVSLKAEQVVLATDRKKKVQMQPVRRLEVGADSLFAFNADSLRSRSKKAQDVKKISSLRLVRDNDPAASLYKLTMGSTDHSLLMCCAEDSSHFLVINASNSTLNLKAVADCNRDPETSKIPKMEIKNTFINVELTEEKAAPGIPRSYSDTDIHRLAVELEMEEAVTFPTGPGIFSNDDMLDLSSNRSSNLTSKSRASSFLAKSDVSSVSGGSIAQVRVGTQSVVEDGQQLSKSSNVMQLSEYSKLPVNELGMRLPAASITHQPGRKSKCRKCAFYNTFSLKKGKMCKNGALCDFCHDTHDRFIHRR